MPLYPRGEDDISTLIGRDEDLARLLGAFEPSSEGEPRLVTLTGLPGAGKSALAAVAAQQLLDSEAVAATLLVALQA
jgi:putative protein kinase ArgK-like GTPase of G3E family